MPNYQQIERELIPTLTPFTHAHSMRAEIRDGIYYVFSYSTLIAYIYISDPNISWFNPDKYSVTTSKQQNLVKRAYATLMSNPYTPAT